MNLPLTTTAQVNCAYSALWNYQGHAEAIVERLTHSDRIGDHRQACQAFKDAAVASELLAIIDAHLRTNQP
jgi:hypothetical protein